MSVSDTLYGCPTVWEKAGIVVALLPLPLVLGWTLATSWIHRNNKHKRWRRVVVDKASHYTSETLNIRQIQWLKGTSLEVYQWWTSRHNLPVTIDEVGEDARLFWIGERRTDKVIMILHGGAFLFPLSPSNLSFWKYVKDELKKDDKDVGLVALNYSLVPTKHFPTQLTQAVFAIRHLIAAGLSPSNLQLVGESAGGNLILQVISHILHPLPSVPELVLSSPFAGACLISPWVALTSDTGSMVSNDDCDMTSMCGLLYYGKNVIGSLPESFVPYLEAAHAPGDWFAEAQTHAVSRILVTAGDRECLRDEIVDFSQALCAVHRGAQSVVQDYGVHFDPIMDFSLPTREVVDDDDKRKGKEKTKVVVGNLTPSIVTWLGQGWD